MTTIFHYLIQVVICSGILYTYYHLALRNKKFHRYNRYYLLGSVVLSLLLPLFSVPFYFSATQTDNSPVLATITRMYSSVVTIKSKSTTNTLLFLNWQNMLLLFYVLIIAVLIFKLVKSISKVLQLTKKYKVSHIDDIRFYNTKEPATPYSFFNHLFWNNKIDVVSDSGQQIFRHEVFHIKQKHSLDILLVELIITIFWINPFFFLLRKELKAIHEFLADEYALQNADETVYAELLLQQLLQTSVTSLVNPFFHNQIKRRITMIIQTQKTTHQYIRKLLVLPLAAVAVLLFSFTYKKEAGTQTYSIQQKNIDTIPKKNPATKIVPGDNVKINSVKITSVDTTPSNRIFEKAEIKPSFSGGEKAWADFLRQHLNPMVPSDKGAAPGSYTVFVQFVVQKDGAITDLKPLTNHGFGMEEEVVRLMKLSPKWEPAIQNGYKVAAYVKQPITFVIVEDDADKFASIPGISKEELLKMDMCKMAGVPDGSLISATFTIDDKTDNVWYVPVKSCSQPARVTELLNETIAGRMITIDNIQIKNEAGDTVKIASKVYKVK